MDKKEIEIAKIILSQNVCLTDYGWSKYFEIEPMENLYDDYCDGVATRSAQEVALSDDEFYQVADDVVEEACNMKQVEQWHVMDVIKRFVSSDATEVVYPSADMYRIYYSETVDFCAKEDIISPHMFCVLLNLYLYADDVEDVIDRF